MINDYLHKNINYICSIFILLLILYILNMKLIYIVQNVPLL